MLKKFTKSKKGFTLVEMIVVIAILAILAAVLVPTLMGVVGDANKKADEAQQASIKSAMQYLVTQGEIDGKDIACNDSGELADSGAANEISKADIITYFDNASLTTAQFEIIVEFHQAGSKAASNVKSITVTYDRNAE